MEWRVTYRKHYYYSGTFGAKAFDAVNNVRIHQWRAHKLRVKLLLRKLATKYKIPRELVLYMWAFIKGDLPAPVMLRAGDGDHLYGDLMRLVDQCGGSAIVGRPLAGAVGSMEQYILGRM
jgi:hypothetical protein